MLLRWSFFLFLLLLVNVSYQSSVKGTGSTATSNGTDSEATSNSQQKTANDGGGTPSAATEKKEEPKGVDWIGAGFVAVLAVNIAALLLVYVGVQRLYQATDICHQMMNTVHRLGLNTIRVGVGPTTKKIIADYTKDKEKDFKDLRA